MQFDRRYSIKIKLNLQPECQESVCTPIEIRKRDRALQIRKTLHNCSATVEPNLISTSKIWRHFEVSGPLGQRLAAVEGWPSFLAGCDRSESGRSMHGRVQRQSAEKNNFKYSEDPNTEPLNLNAKQTIKSSLYRWYQLHMTTSM